MKKIIYIITGIFCLLLIAQTSSAQLLESSGGALQNLTTNTQQLGTASGLGKASIGSIIATIIQAALGFLAAIFLVLMIIAGFQWMTASGNDAQVKKAVDTIKTAIIGLVIVLAAYAITYFIFKYLPFSGSGVGGDGTSGTPKV